jgi:hypothetical protein
MTPGSIGFNNELVNQQYGIYLTDEANSINLSGNTISYNSQSNLLYGTAKSPTTFGIVVEYNPNKPSPSATAQITDYNSISDNQITNSDVGIVVGYANPYFIYYCSSNFPQNVPGYSQYQAAAPNIPQTYEIPIVIKCNVFSSSRLIDIVGFGKIFQSNTSIPSFEQSIRRNSFTSDPQHLPFNILPKDHSLVWFGNNNLVKLYYPTSQLNQKPSSSILTNDLYYFTKCKTKLSNPSTYYQISILPNSNLVPNAMAGVVYQPFALPDADIKTCVVAPRFENPKGSSDSILYNTSFNIQPTVVNSRIEAISKTTFISKIRILDMYGKVVISQNCYSLQYELDVAELSSGVYLIQLFNEFNENPSFSTKFVKQ